MYLGLDCSTQSLSAILIDARSGQITHETSVVYETDLPHYGTTHGFVRGTEPDEFFSDPMMWVEALDLLFLRLLQQNAPLSLVKAISGSCQQHSIVCLNGHFHYALANLSPSRSLIDQLAPCLSRPVSPIWLDASTLPDCDDIIRTIGGNAVSLSITGSSITPRFPAAQIHKYARQFPDRWHETDRVHLASSFLASILCGHSTAIDYSDGAGMNLMNLATLDWDDTMLEATAPGLRTRLPSLAPTKTIAGKVSPYFTAKYGFRPNTQCSLWSGDNPCSLVGTGVLRPGTWVISLGTSYTHFTAIDSPITDPDGYGHIFGNPTGGFMALSCYKNGALACVALKQKLGISWQEFDQALLIPPTESDSPILPFYETEITPNAHASDQSLTTPRSLIDGQFLNIFHHSRWLGELPDSILVTGGISKSNGVCQTLSNIFQRPVHRLKTSSSAALGAALIAAHANGHDVEQLAITFCQPQLGETITPDPSTHPIYQNLAKKFLVRLHDHLQK